MLEGWYCRTLANEKAGGQQEDANVDVDGDSGSDNDSRSAPKVNPNNETNQANTTQQQQQQQDYKSQYLYLKKKLKFLIYENEFFQDALRANQRRLLKVSRDRAFLLDRLMQYEKPDDTSDSDATESSEDEATKEVKKRKTDTGASASSVANSGRGRKRKIPNNDGSQQKSVIVEKTAVEYQSNSNIQEQQQQLQQQQQQLQQQQQQQQMQQHQQLDDPSQQQGHMTPAEVERHLQSRQSVLELIPEKASATVPTEMFSNEPSLDGEPHDQFDGSPTHVAAEECVQMEYAN